MKKKYIVYLGFTISLCAFVLSSCTDSYNLSYKGPSVLEFKNYYLEIQSRIGVANLQLSYVNVVPSENLTLSALTVEQASVVRTGTITTSLASTTVTGIGTLFTTQLAVGSVLKDALGNVIGFVSAIATPNSLTLIANARLALAGSGYRAASVPDGRQIYQDSVLVQLVGSQRSADLNVDFIKDTNPAGATQAVEGVHFDFVRNASGKLVVKANRSSGYIYINVYDALGAADPDRLTLRLTLQPSEGVQPSENYKTFTYNIIK